MNILRDLAQARSKNQTVYNKKEKLPTQDKTIKHKCSQCRRDDAKLLRFGKDKRWLCIVCIKKFNNKNEDNKVSFVRASELYKFHV